MTARTAPYFPQVASGDGTTKNFALSFPILDNAHLRVFVGGVLKALGTDYTLQDAAPNTPAIYTSHVSGADTTKKHVVFASAPANSANNVKFYRNTPIARPNPANTVQIGPDVALYAHFRQQERDDKIIVLEGNFGETRLLAPTALSFTAPCDGYVGNVRILVNKTVTTGGTLTVAIDGTPVTGEVVTIANSAAVGAFQEVPPTALQASYTVAKKGQAITVTPASFATAGDVNVEIDFQPADLT